MDRETQTRIALFVVACPKLNRGVKLEKQTWEEHVLPEHPEVENYVKQIKEIIGNTDAQQDMWRMEADPTRLCIVRRVPYFQPANKYILIALRIYSDTMACVTSVYPVDNLPSEGVKLL